MSQTMPRVPAAPALNADHPADPVREDAHWAALSRLLARRPAALRRRRADAWVQGSARGSRRDGYVVAERSLGTAVLRFDDGREATVHAPAPIA